MEPSRQQIRFCEGPDGVRLAYAVSGQGPPLVKAANYLTHLEFDWQGPVWRHWLEELGRHHTLIRYDERGCGLSDRDVDEFSTEAWLRDLETIVDAAELERFALFGMSQGASVGIAYAARHPDRVTRLILCGGYARGRLERELTPEGKVEAETMINVIRVGWGQENPAFRQLFSTQLMPEGSTDQIEWLNELARNSSAPETAARMERAFYNIDVTPLARKVTSPSLVFHARHDAAIPFDEGRLLATLIPDARFVPLESRNHILLKEEPAWARFLDEFRLFLGTGTSAGQPGLPFPDLTPREREVLDLVARGLTNRQIADELFISEKTVRNHLTHIFGKLDLSHRSEAIVRAREAGLGHREEA